MVVGYQFSMIVFLGRVLGRRNISLLDVRLCHLGTFPIDILLAHFKLGKIFPLCPLGMKNKLRPLFSQWAERGA